ncbi:MAG: D-2-hydroxyacid dehydrogenase [Chloroflexi bacterium]|nr:D-2-hydroxyacid dehydrogenase [Chloroflexota bacterium]
MPTITILIGLKFEEVSPEQLQKISTLASGAEIIITDDRKQMEQILDRVEIAAGSVPIDLVLKAPRLRWFQQWSAGADWMMEHPEIGERDLVVTSASGVHAVPISEHIIALLLAFARDLPSYVRAQTRHEWIMAETDSAFELVGKTLLLIGVGSIGLRTARIADALDMHVIGVRHNPSEEVPEVEEMYGPDDLPRLLPQADFVVSTVPLTEETRHMIGEQELSLMRPEAILINIGRGGTIDEHSLVKALRERRIAGAGLDVFETEPLPPDSPLWDLENVIITPHASGATPEYNDRAMRLFLDNLERFQAGKELRNVVSKKQGY